MGALRLDQALDAYVKAPNLFRCPSDSAWGQTEGPSYGWVELFDHQRLARIYEGPTEVHKHRVLARHLLS